MILTLLAALNGAAQQVFVIYQNAESSHFVDAHLGSSYNWRVLVDFGPDTEANPNDYTLMSSNGSDEIRVRWEKTGWYYLDITETNITGCTNRKVLPVNVVSNNRSIAFNTTLSSDCYSPLGNGFGLPLTINDDGGTALDEAKFPVDVSFTINGNAYSQQIAFDQKVLNVDASMFAVNPLEETFVSIILSSASDIQGVNIPTVAGQGEHTRNIHAEPQIEFTYSDLLVSENSAGNYEVSLLVGTAQNATYNWFVEPSTGTSSDLSSITGNQAEIVWDGPIGNYRLVVNVLDGNGCTDTVATEIQIQDNTTGPVPGFVGTPGFAGPDTIIGSCDAYQFAKAFVADTTFTFAWEPAENLSDPGLLNPVFTPDNTTTYYFTITNQEGFTFTDTVTVTVSEIIADAGADVVMEQGSTILLDGSGSVGEDLIYYWTTQNGSINSGENSPYPEIDQPGDYFLEVHDSFGCIRSDSVKVTRLATALIANNDYDTTSYRTAVDIAVLENDIYDDAEIDPLSLQIINYPLGGTVDVNISGSVLTYTPGAEFTGTDVFEYRICDLSQQCDNATVYVLVSPSDFLIPQAFTPNGDNINDLFEIIGIEYYPNNSITIINRLGKKVYEAKAYGINTTPQFWDGKSNVGSYNDDLTTGTYFYVLDLGNGEKPIAGSVYLDR